MIDGYCHCGLSKYQPVEDVSAMMDALGIERAVLVQHHGEFDNAYLGGIVAADKRRFRAVALVDPDDLHWSQVLVDAADGGRFEGLRLPHDTILGRPLFCSTAADLGFVLMVDAQRGIRELTTVLETLLEQGNADVVIAHLGYPRIDNGRLVAGRELLALARFPRVHVLLSGTAMWPSAASRSLDEFTLEVIDAFGPDRLMWGSNFPPCGGVAGVRDDLERIESDRWGLTRDELLSVTHGNAARLWFGRGSG